jgi:hypothetical protein
LSLVISSDSQTEGLPMVSFGGSLIDRNRLMPDGLLPILILIAGVIIYVIAKVMENVRKSAKQWEQVDKSKLKEWDDDEDD